MTITDKTAEKRKQILVTALQLFSTKGVAATSMQEIAEVCGMSKGSLYLHFKSKEELEKSIYEHIILRIRDEVFRLDQETGLSPKEQLRKQAEVLLVHFLEVREFLLKQMHDNNPGPGTAPFNHECGMQKAGAALNWFRIKLRTVYGAEIEPYTIEIAMFVGGMLGSYMRFLFLPGLQLNVSMLSAHLVGMLDDMTASLLRRQPEPLVPLDAWERLDGIKAEDTHFSRHPLAVIKALRGKLKEIAIDPVLRSDGLESLELLEKELTGSRPRRAVLKGMVANLEAVEGLEDLLKELRITIHSVLDLYLAAEAADAED